MKVRMRVGHRDINEIWDGVKEEWLPYKLDGQLRHIFRQHDIEPWDSMWFQCKVNTHVEIT